MFSFTIEIPNEPLDDTNMALHCVAVLFIAIVPRALNAEHYTCNLSMITFPFLEKSMTFVAVTSILLIKEVSGWNVEFCCCCKAF